MRYVRVPLARVGVVIGPEGSTRATIESRTGVRLAVDSESGEVEIDDTVSKDPMGPLKAESIVKALGRGFSPEHALRLLSDEVYFTLFDIHDYVGKSRKDVERMVGRLAGTRGKTRRVVEELSGAHVSIYGHTVGIIGDIDSTEVAKSAVDMILTGSEHANVYRFLENKRRRARLERMRP